MTMTDKLKDMLLDDVTRVRLANLCTDFGVSRCGSDSFDCPDCPFSSEVNFQQLIGELDALDVLKRLMPFVMEDYNTYIVNEYKEILDEAVSVTGWKDESKSDKESKQ